jgi:hypothetical protein
MLFMKAETWSSKLFEKKLCSNTVINPAAAGGRCGVCGSGFAHE